MGLPLNDHQGQSQLSLLLCASNHHQRSDLLQVTTVTLALICNMALNIFRVRCPFPSFQPLEHMACHQRNPHPLLPRLSLHLSANLAVSGCHSTSVVSDRGCSSSIVHPPQSLHKGQMYSLLLTFTSRPFSAFKPWPLRNTCDGTLPPAPLVAPIPSLTHGLFPLIHWRG